MTTEDLSSRAAFVHRFGYLGRQYTLFKRSQTVKATYYIHLQKHCKRHHRALETADRRTAVERAKEIIDAVRGSNWTRLEVLKARSTAPSIGDIARIYKVKAVLQPGTKRNNVSCLKLIVRTVLGERIDPLDVLSTHLNGELAARFQEAFRTRYLAMAATDESSQRMARDKADRSSRSIIRQARSLFVNNFEVQHAYAEAKLQLPECVKEFVAAPIRGKATKREYNAPPDSVVQAAFSKIVELREADPHVYLAFWLAAGAGLRKSEAARMRWEWIVERDGQWWISGGIGKNGDRIEVPFQSRAVEALRAFRKTEGAVIPEYVEKWSARLNRWMNTQGWNTEKKMHELRAYVGSRIYQRSPSSAKAFMRHSSITITERFYCRYCDASKPIDVL